jgi:chitin disaccharide deacetylase
MISSGVTVASSHAASVPVVADSPVTPDGTTAGTLAERLGRPADAKLVIISCDDLGSCHAANVGVYRAMRDGLATCASLMVPAPWALHAAGDARDDDDLGVHLTLNAEHAVYRWGPITHAPSLQSGEGGFPRNLGDLWEHADPDEVRRELRAQVDRALAWGLDVTHLAPHLTAITLRPEFFDVYLDLAVDYRLPIRLPSTVSAEQAGFPFRQLAIDEGIVFPDHFDHDWRAGSRDRVHEAVRSLQPGVTEIHVQPAVDTPEVRALTASAQGWIDDLELVTSDPLLPRLLDEQGAELIGYRELRTAMRDG